jgi:hypothetical protein
VILLLKQPYPEEREFGFFPIRGKKNVLPDNPPRGQRHLASRPRRRLHRQAHCPATHGHAVDGQLHDSPAHAPRTCPPRQHSRSQRLVAADKNVQAFNKDSNDPHPRFFPYVTSVDCPEVGLVQFKYLGRPEDDATYVTFLAQLLAPAKRLSSSSLRHIMLKPIECSMKRDMHPLSFIMDPFRPLIPSTILPSDQGAQLRRLLPLMSMVIQSRRCQKTVEGRIGALAWQWICFRRPSKTQRAVHRRRETQPDRL